MRKQMRRVLAVFLAVVLTVTAQPALIKASEDDSVSVSFDEQTATLTLTGRGDVSNLNVSSYAKKTKEIVVGEGITSLESGFFWPFRSFVTKIKLPSSLTCIAVSAFKGCESLTDISLPDGVSSIGAGAFEGCALTDVTIPDSVTELGEGCFFDCTSLKSIHLPSQLTKLGKKTFIGCTSLRNVTIPDSVTELGEDVFEHGGSLCIFCHNAYAVQYCKDNNLTYIDNVNPLDVNQADIILSGEQFMYTGKEIKPAVTLSFAYGSNQTGSVRFDSAYAPADGYLLTEGEDYTLSYRDNTESGTASVTVTGIGIYTGSKTIEYEIYKEITGCDIQQEYTKISYNGEPQRPAITVKDGDTTLVENQDYSLTYQNNVYEGTATVLVRGMGIYKGEKELTFSIYKMPIDSCTISQEYTEIVYDGSEKKPAITVKDAEGNLLEENKHYTLIYENTTNPGMATVFVRGIGIYKSEKQLTYTIEPIDIKPADVKLDETIFTYDGSSKNPQVVVTLAGNTLTQDVDFTLSYENNITAGTAFAVIQGIGHYKGTVKMTFTIVPYSGGGDSVYDKDNTLISNNMIYTITDDEENEVEVTSFSNKKLTNLVIPATVKSGDKEYKVTSIGQKAFYKNTNLKRITIGNNITSIEDYAFYGCKNVTSIKMGKSVEIIGASSFRKCTKLTGIVLPKSVDELGKNAFYGCKKLKTITILADSVVDVSENAIKGISQRAVIKVPKKMVKGYKKELKGKTGFKKTMKLKKK